MNISNIISYCFNPRYKETNALSTYKNSSFFKKFAIALITLTMGILTVGIGALATFRITVGLMNQTTQKTDQKAQDILNPKRAALIQALTQNPASLLDENGKMKEYPGIAECHCHPSLSRNKDSDSRGIFETQLIELISKEFHSKKEPLWICSIAPGSCFQEIVLHAKLTELGYQVNWILADPDYLLKTSDEDKKTSSSITTNTLDQAKQLFQMIDPKSEIINGHDFEHLFGSLESTNPQFKYPTPQVFLTIDSGLGGNLMPIDKEKFDKHAHILPKRFKDNYSGYINLLNKLRIQVETLETAKICGILEKDAGNVKAFLQYYPDSSK
ncbi:MAG: hypothetical protein P4L16_03195 [Chlamydiales bacterium]|nr:hypothetical protein [Chlamydiales bacterium]